MMQVYCSKHNNEVCSLIECPKCVKELKAKAALLEETVKTLAAYRRNDCGAPNWALSVLARAKALGVKP